MSQEIKEIDINELVLWTENPRDPIDENASNEDIVRRAIEDSKEKWFLEKLAEEMGPHYDYSELPTVVYHEKKPIVYDGNRRVVLALLKNGLVKIDNLDTSFIPTIPMLLPCNVCSEDTAVKNVYRKHANKGSWSPLERDVFMHKFMGKEKSTFLMLDESTKLIQNNPALNKVFVRDEIFTAEKLEKLGLKLENDVLYSRHNESETKSILDDICDKISSKEISTRGENRGNIYNVLEKGTRDIITKNAKNDFSKANAQNAKVKVPVRKQTSRTRPKEVVIFGKDLYLSPGSVSNLYRDIKELYGFYCDNKAKLSNDFHAIIRMSLRLLTETAAKDLGLTIDNYLRTNFAAAKTNLSSNDKTTLHAQNVTVSTILPLLHVGAHDYDSAKNIIQTLAMSLIIGEMLMITHGK